MATTTTPPPKRSLRTGLSPSRRRRAPAPTPPPVARPVPPLGPMALGILELFREDPPSDPEGLAFYRRALLRARAIDFGLYR